MVCAKCGSKIREDGKFCLECGAPVNRPEETAAPKPSAEPIAEQIPDSVPKSKPAHVSKAEKETRGKLWQLAFCAVVVILVIILGIRSCVSSGDSYERPEASTEYQTMLDQYGFEDVTMYPAAQSESFIRTYTASGGLNINCKLQKAEYIFEGNAIKGSVLYHYYQDTLTKEAREALKKSAGPGAGVNEWLLFDGYVVAVNYDQAPFYQGGISDWQSVRKNLISFGWIER